MPCRCGVRTHPLGKKKKKSGRGSGPYLLLAHDDLLELLPDLQKGRAEVGAQNEGDSEEHVGSDMARRRLLQLLSQQRLESQIRQCESRRPCLGA